MKRIFICKIYLILVVSFIVGCERDRKGDPINLLVKNITADTILASTQFNYPDTSLLNYTNTPKCVGVSISSNSEGKFPAYEGWVKYLKDQNSKKTLIIVIYSADTLKKYSFSQIQNDYNILKRYDLHLDKLKELDWIIRYP